MTTHKSPQHHENEFENYSVNANLDSKREWFLFQIAG